ncbi:MAG TPA: SDR family oxidoreductase [Candidatus Polarisedimenticolia bacterium]|nr:SDR family oxidoreductase [Candidatus Polarisedimenticolia bacterium]
MPSRFLDADQARRHAEHRYDFNRKALAGRVVLLPGGAGGLGAAITALLLQDGALPVVAYRSARGRALAFQQKLQDLYGGPVTLVEADVSKPEGRQRCLDAAFDVKGELYGLVALTGDPARVKPPELDGPALEASFAANYEAPILLARAAAERMMAKDTHGAIVLFSSMQGVHPFEGSLAYAGPKAAIIHAARILAKEFGGETDIRVNVVAPGATTAGMARASIDSGKYDRYVERGVIPRFGRPEDVAKVVRLLLEPDSYITGQVITVDGGLTLRRDALPSG